VLEHRETHWAFVTPTVRINPYPLPNNPILPAVGKVVINDACLFGLMGINLIANENEYLYHAQYVALCV
jgi:hypothetical protein